MTYLSDWDPYERFVQGGFKDGQFASAQYLVLAAGPPRLANIGGALSAAQAFSTGQVGGDEMAYPIGLTQSFSIAQNGQFFEVFEIGSRRGFFLQGRHVNQVSLGRTVYHGPSLLRMLYAYYQDTNGPVKIDSVFPNVGIQNVANKHDVIQTPGYENFFINLMSDLFTQPVGLLFLLKDSNKDTIGAGYCEQCYVPQHVFGTDANGVMIQEQCTLQFERVVPIRVNAIDLMTAEEAARLDAFRNVEPVG